MRLQAKGISVTLKIMRVLALLLVVPFIAACPNQVNPATPDVTPPTLGLDAHNIPVQPGAPSQSSPETITPDCCDLDRIVKPGTITLIAGAVDKESGLRSVSIWVVNSSATCVDANGIATKSGPGLVGGPAARNPSTTAPSPVASTAPDQLIVSYNVVIAARPAGCVQYFSNRDVYAEAENSAGKKVQTKRFGFSLKVT
ncbi:hypothetical protein [Herbidospora cretacea]|uniref:hypothetical protein n=1 Tax=Herbidospora cretacea TaxID=28444 RepID=UPI0012F81AE0|nr:hypothetical protein [Herbidospora cretacea]